MAGQRGLTACHTCLSLAARRALCRGVSASASCSRSSTASLESHLCASLSTEAAGQKARGATVKVLIGWPGVNFC